MRAALFYSLAFATGCVHPQKVGTPETLRPTAERFHQLVRWRDYRGALDLLVPERREAFQRSLQSSDEEKDLTVTDYQLEEVQLLDGGQRARVTSRISWVRLPSVSERSELVTSEYVFREGLWLLERQQGGPFGAALGR